MSSTPPSQPALAESVPSAILSSEKGFRRAGVDSRPGSQLGPRRTGYGLPCVKCKTYYAADLSACPVCKAEERMLPEPVVAGSPSFRSSESVVPTPPDSDLEAERERFLQEFRAQVHATGEELDGEIGGSGILHCVLEAHHQDGPEPATVCEDCYARLQQRVDLLEAALHMDLKQATQLIYDAVWSDPSDPSKTYHNAARAVLGELRKRAGISAVLGPLQSLAH